MIERWRWLLPLVVVWPGVWVVSALVGVGKPLRCVLLLALAFSAFLVDGMLIDLSPHWSQKHAIAAYYAQRESAAEPLLVWELFWHGENLYTGNEIYRSPVATERTVFLGARTVERLRDYLATHAGRRVFILVERAKLEGLKSALPPAVRATLRMVDESNNELVLVSAHA